jgi:uncharacterized protein YbcI
MHNSQTMAHQVAQAASAFQQQRTGHAPRSTTVVFAKNTIVVTMHDALSPAEKALAKTAAGAAQVQEFHRQLFISTCESLRADIKRITGVEVREAVTGTVVQVFTSGAMVQVFLLAGTVATETWSGTGENNQSS